MSKTNENDHMRPEYDFSAGVRGKHYRAYEKGTNLLHVRNIENPGGANMKPEEIKQEISKLNLAQKLLLIEEVWDSIAQSNSELPMPDWQKCELDNRYAEYKAGEQDLHDWQSVHEEIRNKYK